MKKNSEKMGTSMDNNKVIITLFSSDATVQYTKDIFSVLALPRGSSFRFRYESRYIDPNVIPLLETGKELTIRSLIAFRHAHNPDDNSHDFFIPARLAIIKSAEKMAGGLIINFVASGYPCFQEDHRVTDLKSLGERAKQVFDSERLAPYAVWGKSMPGVDMSNDPARDEENWREICKAISLLPGYDSCHFLKCTAPYSEEWDAATGRSIRNESHLSRGVFQLTEGRSFIIDVEYYEKSYDRKQNRNIDVILDDNVLTRTRGMSTLMQSRYGSVKLGFRPKTVESNTVSEILIRTKGATSGAFETEVPFPVVIIKSKGRRVVKTLLPTFGALLIALPGILTDAIPLTVNVLFGSVGVIVVGISNYMSSRWE